VAPLASSITRASRMAAALDSQHLLHGRVARCEGRPSIVTAAAPVASIHDVPIGSRRRATMTEQDRDLTMNVFNPDTKREADAGPDAERDESGLGEQPASGQTGWQGSETADGEPSSVGQADSGSIGAGGGIGSMAGQMEQGWQDQSAGQDGGLLGQEGVAGGEGWEGKARDIGADGWTTGDAGFGNDTSDDGGANPDQRTDLG
jgi:hypothetical protein